MSHMPTVAAQHKNRYQNRRKSHTNEEKKNCNEWCVWLPTSLSCAQLFCCFFFFFRCCCSYRCWKILAAATFKTPCGDSKTSKPNKLSPKTTRKCKIQKCSNIKRRELNKERKRDCRLQCDCKLSNINIYIILFKDTKTKRQLM